MFVKHFKQWHTLEMFKIAVINVLCVVKCFALAARFHMIHVFMSSF